MTDLQSKSYDDFVRSLLASSHSVKLNVELMKPEEVDLFHAAVGVSTEALELLDALKKAVFYGKPIDWENVIEEVGDIQFYLQAALNVLSLRCPGRDPRLENRAKLMKRYPKGTFTSADAAARADKI
jgi:NTP pyrophosphatase (non-canonical NTP hydrolase)